MESEIPSDNTASNRVKDIERNEEALYDKELERRNKRGLATGVAKVGIHVAQVGFHVATLNVAGAVTSGISAGLAAKQAAHDQKLNPSKSHVISPERVNETSKALTQNGISADQMNKFATRIEKEFSRKELEQVQTRLVEGRLTGHKIEKLFDEKGSTILRDMETSIRNLPEPNKVKLCDYVMSQEGRAAMAVAVMKQAAAMKSALGKSGSSSYNPFAKTPSKNNSTSLQGH